jgi:hypothetical protein
MQRNNSTPCVRADDRQLEKRRSGGGGAKERAAAGFKRAPTDAYFAFSADTFVGHQNAMREQMYFHHWIYYYCCCSHIYTLHKALAESSLLHTQMCSIA